MSHLLAVFIRPAVRATAMAGSSQNLKGRGVGQHEHPHTSYKQCASMYVCVSIYVCVHAYIYIGLVSEKNKKFL